MSTMTDTIIRQVSEQVQMAMETANSTRPLPYFDYMATTACEPSHRLMRVPSPHHTDKDREASQSNWNGLPQTGNRDRLAAATTRPSSRPRPVGQVHHCFNALQISIFIDKSDNTDTNRRLAARKKTQEEHTSRTPPDRLHSCLSSSKGEAAPSVSELSSSYSASSRNRAFRIQSPFRYTHDSKVLQ
ncbi:hypothetical protein Cgig2_028579 [Carnegiea gigantea]|uniref:Uncharacterized protein n=1 Tax=Carnegiea gigantea TaxID=171969 RepID=A0A9Q1QC05_9CARY|nr:hypothetical protein Cgig2_028579 [Carnegiea gigantea]